MLSLFLYIFIDLFWTSRIITFSWLKQTSRIFTQHLTDWLRIALVFRAHSSFHSHQSVRCWGCCLCHLPAAVTVLLLLVNLTGSLLGFVCNYSKHLLYISINTSKCLCQLFIWPTLSCVCVTKDERKWREWGPRFILFSSFFSTLPYSTWTFSSYCNK